MTVDLHRTKSWVRSVFALAGIALCAELLSAQTPPNFSGTWEGNLVMEGIDGTRGENPDRSKIWSIRNAYC
jgi:hypothetical protein